MLAGKKTGKMSICVKRHFDDVLAGPIFLFISPFPLFDKMNLVIVGWAKST